MINKFKRTLAILLAAAVLTVFAAIPVFAAEPETTPSEETSSETAPAPVPTPAAPVIQFPTEPTNTGVSVSVAAADTLDGEAKLFYCIGEGEWSEYTEPFLVTENTSISAKVVSGSNVQSSITTVSVECIDKIAPSRPTIVADNTTWTNSFVTVSLTNGTDNESGYLRSEYRLDADGAWLEYTGEFTVNNPVTVFARGVDNAQNYSEEVYMCFANFDVTAPDIGTLLITPGNDKGPVRYGSSTFSTFFSGYVSCTIDGAVDAQSGVAYYEYQLVPSSAYINDAAWKRYDSAKPPKFTEDFIGYIYARAIDNAGNVSKPVPSIGIVIDSTAPVISDISKSVTTITEGKVTVTFSVNENISIDYITVNEDYVGIYSPSFVAYRNGEYKIVACDKAGNKSTASVIIDNIQTTPFNILKMADSLVESEYTPSSWANMQKYAAELRNLLAVETNEAIINSAADQLTNAMEGLVVCGDGTYARELIDRVNTLDKNVYTETSWKFVDDAIAKLNTVLENKESSQLDIDNARAELETATTNLVLVANFTALERIISTVEDIDPDEYPADRYKSLMDKVAEAKALSRTDTDQATADRYYSEILTLMGELNINTIPDGTEDDGKLDVIHLLIIGVVILAIAVAVAIILILTKGGKNDDDNNDDDDNDDDDDDDDDGDKAYFYEARQRRPAAAPAREEARDFTVPTTPSSQRRPDFIPPRPRFDLPQAPAQRRDSSEPHASFGDIHFGDEGEYNDWE